MKRTTNIVIVVICIILLIILITVTYQAITVTPNWTFTLDFGTGKDVITSYGAIAGGIIAMLSAILLVYTIFSQLSQFKHQNKQFNKQLKVQKKQFAAQFALQEAQFLEDKRREDDQEKRDYFFKLKLIDVFLDSILKYIDTTAKEIKAFIDREKEEPLKSNVLFFAVDKNMNRLNDMDYLEVFKTFQFFYDKENDIWINNFNNLFNTINFYSDAVEELRTNTKNHIKDKFERKREIAEMTKEVLDLCVKIMDAYRRLDEEDYLKYPYAVLINDLIPAYYDILEKDLANNGETDLNEMSQDLFLPFLQAVLNVRAEIGFDEYGIEQLSGRISTIRKKIFQLKSDSTYFIQTLEKRYIEYFSEESGSREDLQRIKIFISIKLEQLDIDNL